jgi:hypothetical protein
LPQQLRVVVCGVVGRDEFAVGGEVVEDGLVGLVAGGCGVRAYPTGFDGTA